MNEKEIKKLNRAELLQILIEQMEENERLKRRIEELEAQQADRSIMIDRAGSIAEASLQVSGVFAAAEEAAQLYLENIRRLSGDQEAACDRMIRDAQEKADRIVAEAEAYRSGVVKKVRRLFQEHESLKQMIRAGEQKTP